MHIRILVYLTWVNVVLPFLGIYVVADSHDCPSCGCAGKESTTISSFISQVNGERGDPGSNGIPGAQGPRGHAGMRGSPGPQGFSGPKGFSSSPSIESSCLALRNSGNKQSGFYTINPATISSEFQVYCDMEVDGGGWTLVASVHENNIDAKCVTGDNWSDNQGNVGKSSANSWSNTWTFGNIESATSQDYKNSAYFNLPASDVMVWHVPNNSPPSQWANDAFLKYYTNDSFLTQYGSSLQNMYLNHLHMERQASINTGLQLKPIMNILKESSEDIRNAIPDFYMYKFDGRKKAIYAKVSIAYDRIIKWGNKVSVRSGMNDSDWHRVQYENIYNSNPTYEVANTAESHPFITLMYITNSEGNEETFDIKVQTRTTDEHGKGGYSSYDREFELNNYNLKYKTYNVYGVDGVPSYIEVHFVVYSFEIWKSVVNNETNFYQPIEWSNGTYELLNILRVSGYPRNILLGHTLLSKDDSTDATIPEIENTLRRIVRYIDDFNPVYDLNAIVTKLSDASEELCGLTTNFHKYKYSSSYEVVVGRFESVIEDGGGNMYDVGNKVSVRSGSSDFRDVLYGSDISGNNAYKVSSTDPDTHPFLTLMHIENRDGSEDTFDIKVFSRTSQDGSASSSFGEGEISYDGFHMKYKTYNIYAGANRNPTICEVYFVVYNFEMWNSVISNKPGFFEFHEPNYSTYRWTSNIIRVKGNPRNILLGYTLFSRSEGIPPPSSHVKDALMIMLKKMSTYDTMNGVGCSRLGESAVTPVQFHTGSPQDVANSIPPTQRLDTTAGYLQFRAVSPEGLPFAMCPGVKTESCRPSSNCIGGINTLEDDVTACGDFTGYAGVLGDKPTETEPDGSARSRKDLKSSILIFTRDSNSGSMHPYVPKEQHINNTTTDT